MKHWLTAALGTCLLGLVAPTAGCGGGDSGPGPQADGGPGEADAAPAPGAVDADGADAGPEEDGTVHFEGEIYPVVKARCAVAGCHDTANQTNHFSSFATAAATHARWVNGAGFDYCVPRTTLYLPRILVVPGQPGMSMLIDRISSTREELCNDNHPPRMPPPPLPRLSDEEIERITRWVAQGARRN